MASGIAPAVLRAQVENTAPWALDTPAPARGWRDALRDAPALEAHWQSAEGRLPYLRLLLAAHFATVATFVPTDVDARIRHHAWQELHGRDALACALAVVDEAAQWPADEVSARTVPAADGEGMVSGHDGEWLAVRAGALGRALQMRDGSATDALAAAIDAELSREARAFAAVLDARGRELDALRTATVLAHNTGDLSRVVEDWPAKGAAAAALAARFARLGHDDAARYGGLFARAGAINKAVMAMENHRFLALRKPRGLRRARALLLPIGPFFDAWGEQLARHPRLTAEDRGEALAALLEGHESDPSQQGYLRAIAGLHRAHGGGVDALAARVPARLRKLLAGGLVREALRVDPERFDARMVKRYLAARALGPGA